ncbi:LOW QUALITY PROTEIN: hypothetical protein ACHAXT_012760 [Thalassiosira profunda]
MASAGDIPGAIGLPQEAVDAIADEEDRALFGERYDIERLKRNDPRCKALRMMCHMRSFRDSPRLERPAWERLGAYVAANDHLQKLDLDDCELDDSNMAALFGTLTASVSLREMVLTRQQGWSFGVNGVRCMAPFLASSSALTSIDIGQNSGIDSECLESLLDALAGGNVETLDFTACDIRSLSALGECALPNLRTLKLGYNRITDVPPQALANCNHLVHLDLACNKIGESGFHAIACLLRGGSRLNQLHLTSTAMNDTDMAIIANSLKCNRRLHTLHK